jgi:hypothetical protein
VDTPRDPQASCGFCDGTGVWADPERGPTACDPCPHCDGSGVGPGVASGATRVDEDRPSIEPQLPAVLAALPRLDQTERQRVYEELHARFDCRIYRG